MFQKLALGRLVAIDGTDPQRGPWRHHAFVPEPLPTDEPALSGKTYRGIAAARASLAALDSTSRQLPNPTLLRMPTLSREAQSTSALEGTYAPLAEVLIADDEEPQTQELVEILNYVRTATYAFDWVEDARPLTASFLCDLQGILMRGTPLEDSSGRLRDTQVVIGQREDADPKALPVENARFVPPPPGPELETGLASLMTWIQEPHADIDPLVSAAMAHYQFETLHPFRDGNGRIGRLLIVLTLVHNGLLEEPTLTVSPWFEARRRRYYDRLLAVSTDGDWDGYIAFFAEGLRRAADDTHTEMRALVAVQGELKDVIRGSRLRADNAHALVDLAVANPSFTVRKVQEDLGVSYPRANTLVGQLVDLGVLAVVDADAYKRRFYAPRVLEVLTGGSDR